MVTVPFTFANQSGFVPASELDANFAALANISNLLTPSQFGAVGNGIADDTAALNAWWAALITTPQTSGWWRSGTYKISGGGLNFTMPGGGILGRGMPNIITDGAASVIVDSSAITSGPAVTFSGPTGTFQMTTFQGVCINGGTAGTNEGVRVNGAGFFTLSGWAFLNLGVGVRWYNLSSGIFTEGVVCDHCYFDTTVTVWEQYSVAAGTNSFRSTGLHNCLGNLGNGSNVALIDSGAFPYLAPLDFTVWTTPVGAHASTLIVNNNGSNLVSTLGDITIEMNTTNTAVTLASANLIQHKGGILVSGNQAGTNKVTKGTLISVREQVAQSDGSFLALPENQNYVPQTIGSTGATITVTPLNLVSSSPTVAPNDLFNYLLSVNGYNVSNGYDFRGTYVVTRLGSVDSGNLAVSAALATHLDAGSGSWPAVTVGVSGGSLTFANADWTSGSKLAYSLSYLTGSIAQQ